MRLNIRQNSRTCSHYVGARLANKGPKGNARPLAGYNRNQLEIYVTDVVEQAFRARGTMALSRRLNAGTSAWASAVLVTVIPHLVSVHSTRHRICLQRLTRDKVMQDSIILLRCNACKVLGNGIKYNAKFNIDTIIQPLRPGIASPNRRGRILSTCQIWPLISPNEGGVQGLV